MQRLNINQHLIISRRRTLPTFSRLHRRGNSSLKFQVDIWGIIGNGEFKLLPSLFLSVWMRAGYVQFSMGLVFHL
jgi:hypothetical protein